MRIYFGGSEINSHRSVLQESNAKHVAMSYMGLRRRQKFSKPWLVRDKFWEGTSVFLDSGAYTLNTKTDVSAEDLGEIYEHYQDFVNANLDAVDMVSEFDVLALGRDWIEEQRDTFWSTIPKEKFMAVWHPVWGVPYLYEMASQYEIIGIPSTSLEGRELRPVLNSLASDGIRLHGVAMTKMDEMQSIKWHSVASTSWISPQRFGDTIVWTGNALKRYPRKMKAQARLQHRTLFANEGFDAAAIEADDPGEVLRLSVWSWQQFERYINQHGGVVDPMDQGVTPISTHEEDNNVSSDQNEVVPHANSGVNGGSTNREIVRREANQVLPVMGLAKKKVNEKDEDSEEVPVVTIRSESARVCNSCFLAQKCPAFQADANCQYNIPILIRTREQFKALRYGLVEMQAQRVMFMKMTEDMEGGYADPNLTKEMSLLDKMMAQVHQEEQEGFSVTLTAKGSSQQAGSGMMSRLFGDQVAQRVQELPAPIQADQVIDAEIVSE